MTVSIIIAVKDRQNRLDECVAKCRELDYPDFEIIVLPDFEIPAMGGAPNHQMGLGAPVLVVPTGEVNPARKRDMALDHAKGEILAFIDDDAYPAKEWLKSAIENFSDPEVAAVGGPAITAAGDTLRQKASGIVYSSPIVSGRYAYRYQPGKRMYIDDYPSCNLLVRKSVMLELGGFNTDFWPGEDTKLCLDITARLKKKIVYDPRALVYHHRRPLYLAHAKQTASYALHRGYFLKRYPATSLKISYLLPTVLLAGIIFGGALSVFTPFFRMIYLSSLAAYLLAVFSYSVRNEPRFIPYVFWGIILTHITYGLYFLKGLCSGRLKEEGAR